MPAPTEVQAKIKESDLEWQATRGSGKGGQARNKTSNAVQMRHKPSGLTVRVESERSQSQNRQTAIRLLAARLQATETDRSTSQSASSRRTQVGSGQRGDKVRTIRTQDDSVVQHVSGKRTTVGRYLKGYLDDLA